MCIYVWYVQVSMKAWGNRPVQQELGVTGGCKVGAGNQSRVPCKGSTCPWLLSHLSSSILYTRAYIKFCSFSMKNSSWGFCANLVAHGSKLSSFVFIFSSGTYGFLLLQVNKDLLVWYSSEVKVLRKLWASPVAGRKKQYNSEHWTTKSAVQALAM